MAIRRYFFLGFLTLHSTYINIFLLQLYSFWQTQGLLSETYSCFIKTFLKHLEYSVYEKLLLVCKLILFFCVYRVPIL